MLESIFNKVAGLRKTVSELFGRFSIDNCFTQSLLITRKYTWRKKYSKGILMKGIDKNWQKESWFDYFSSLITFPCFGVYMIASSV